MKIEFVSKLIGKEHRLTFTPDRITLKTTTDCSEEDLERLKDFQNKILESGIKVDMSYRGHIKINNKRIEARLRNSSKMKKLKLVLIDGKLNYDFANRGE